MTGEQRRASSTRDRPKKAVIADVAELAGVSVPTVSRVLTGNIPVSERLRERVNAAIRELDYRPNGAARALVEGRQAMVAVVSTDTTKYGSSATIFGIQEAAKAVGYTVLVATISEPGGIDSTLDLVLGQPVSGIIVLEFDHLGAKFLSKLPSTVPVVAVAGAKPGDSPRPHAFIDDHWASKRATEFLLRLGHQQVQYIGIPFSPPSGRINGWVEAHLEAGRMVPEPQIAGWDATSVNAAIDILFAGSAPTAILCGNDELAMGAIRALHDRGWRVPEDVSVMGIDGHPLGDVWLPSITTMTLDFTQLGRDAFGLIGFGASAGPSANRTIRPVLTIRESTAVPKA